jgi:hypothetical protein
MPAAIAAQNRRCSSRPAADGRPGDDNGARSHRSERRLCLFIATSFVKVLRRPLESAQYVSIKYTERLAEAGIEPSVGSVGDSYDCSGRDRQRSVQGRGHPSTWPVAVVRGRRVRDVAMGRLVQQSPAAGAHRQHPAGRGRGALLRHAGPTSYGGVTQTKQPPGNPGRFNRKGEAKRALILSQTLSMEHSSRIALDGDPPATNCDARGGEGRGGRKLLIGTARAEAVGAVCPSRRAGARR